MEAIQSIKDSVVAAAERYMASEMYEDTNNTSQESSNGNNTQQVIDPLNEADLTKPENARACRRCRDATSLETPYHLYTECPAVWGSRRDHLQTYQINVQHPFWRPQAFVDFFKSLHLEN